MVSPETNTTPIEVTPPIPEVPPIQAEEASTALLGLRRFITAFRFDRVSETLADREEHDHVIVSAPAGALQVRSFKSAPETPDVVPITMSERFTSWHRQRQVKKMRKAERERWRINESYGKPTKLPPVHPVPTRTRPQQERMSNPRKERMSKILQDMAESDAGKSNDLGSDEHRLRLFGGEDESGNRVRPARLRGYQRRAELADASKDRKAERKAARIRQRLDKGTAARSVPARTRSRRIEKGRKKQERLGEHLEELRQLVPIAERKKEERRQRRQDRVNRTAHRTGVVVGRTGRQLHEYVRSIGPAYQEGKSDDAVGGKIQMGINKVARSAGRRLAKRKK